MDCNFNNIVAATHHINAGSKVCGTNASAGHIENLSVFGSDNSVALDPDS